GWADHLLGYPGAPAAADAPRAVRRDAGRPRPLARVHARRCQGGRLGAAARGHAVGLPRARRALTREHVRGRAMTAEEPLAAVLAALEIERLGPDEFRGRSLPQLHGRVYGGQVLAQALLAAEHTVPTGRLPHSLHGYFLRPGDLE